MLLKVDSFAETCLNVFRWLDHRGQTKCARLPSIHWILAVGSKGHKVVPSQKNLPSIVGLNSHLHATAVLAPLLPHFGSLGLAQVTK
jgi:hypothetical protein